MDDDTTQDATHQQPAPTDPSGMRILPEAVWGAPNGGAKAPVSEAAPEPAPEGGRSSLDEWYPESWWAWKRGSGSRAGVGPSATAEPSSSGPADAAPSEEDAPDPVQGQEAEAEPDSDDRPLFDQEEGEGEGSLPSAPTLDDEFAFLAPHDALADLDPGSQPAAQAFDSEEPAESGEAAEAEEPAGDEEPEAAEPEPAVAGGQAIAWDAPSDQMDIPDQWVFGGARFGGSRRKRSARHADDGPKPAGKRSRFRRRPAEPEPSPLFDPEEEGEALVSAGRHERGRA